MKKTILLILLFGLLVSISACKPENNQSLIDQEKMNQAKLNLNIEFQMGDSINLVTVDISLQTIMNDVSISWLSSHVDVISNTGVVTRPDDEDVVVTLTATLTYKQIIDTKIFILTVIKNEQEVYDITKRTALNENEQTYIFQQRDTYQNPIEIENQWGGANPNRYAYGIGDPFVMRFNGKYYLYPSTQDRLPGVRVYESDDMIHWTYKGYAVSESEDSSVGAYAPEVVYYQGYFYLVQSRGGSGHFIYRAEHPLGPFIRITGNLGRGIDGSFHINDDGRIFLLHTGIPAGLRMSEILFFPESLGETDIGILGPQRLMETANLNHWIEGPGVIRRDDISYLTYTGNHIGSLGYRVAYSYTMGNMFSHQDFIQPQNNVTIISTKNDYSSLGHSSNAYGPNLDSIYTAYHNRSNLGRRYNLDRYVTNGVRLTTNAAFNHFGTVPDRPDFEAQDGTQLTKDFLNFYMSSQVTKDYFTAEFNYIMNQGDVVLNYQSYSQYLKVSIDPLNHTISLIQIDGNQTNVLKTEDLGLGNRYDRLTELRVEKSLSKIRIFYNRMLKLEMDYEGSGGKIGYMGNSDIFYTAFQNDVNGSSDFEVIHGVPSNIPAQTYLKNENRGFRFYGENLTNHPIRNGEPNNIIYKDHQYAVLLNTRDDFVKYPIESLANRYALVAEITKESLGSIIEIVINEEHIVKVDVPRDIKFPEGTNYLPVHLTDLYLSGQSTIKFRLFSGQFEFRQFQLYEDATMVEFDNLNGQQLMSEMRQVAQGSYMVDGDEIHSSTSNIFMALLGSSGVSNFEFSVDVALMSSGVSDGGIVFRAKNYSFHNDQPTQSFQGYYLKIQARAGTFYKYDYGATTLQSIALIDQQNNSLFTEGIFNTIKVISYHNNIRIFINGIEYLNIDLTDQFMDGQIGFFSRNTHFAYKNVSYKTLDE